MIRRMIFGDNLTVMREGIADKSVHLCCTDPPFNSGRNYNTFLPESDAMRKAFVDTWTWDEPAEKARTEIRQLAREKDTYKRLNNCLEGYDMVLQNAVSGQPASLRAYLAFMGPRIAEMHRVLRDDGSIYLHCDPSASHYLKGMMDAIFGAANFRNEIIWFYDDAPGRATRWFPRKHDVILWYTKSPKKWTFNADEVRVPILEASKERYKSARVIGGKSYVGGKTATVGKIPEDVWKLPIIKRNSKESLGYPTQKPMKLLERIIKASSNPGDVVLDPFAGCGTTIDAAQALERQWIGIDLTILALDPMQKRLRERYGFNPSIDYDIEGYPTTVQEAIKLARDEKKYHDFANWAVTRLGLEPTTNVGDGGIDGILPVKIWDSSNMEQYVGKVVAEVKSGKPSIAQVRAFCTAMRNQEADIGIFIMLNCNTTKSMLEQREREGYIEHNGQRYHRLQFWNIDDAYFASPESINERIKVPWVIRARNKSERHISEHQLELPAASRDEESG